MKLIKLLAVFTTFLVLTVPGVCAGQQDDGVAAIKTADGYLLVWNHPGLHFTLTIRGKDVQPQNSTEHVFFNVDGMFFQVQSVAISEFMKDAGKQKPDDKAILTAHRDWESEFIQSSVLNKKINVQTVPQKLKDGSEALLWKFDMPELPAEMHSTAKEQVYLTMVTGDHVILLNASVEGTITEVMVETLVLDTISTLKVSAKPINVRELQETIRKGKP